MLPATGGLVALTDLFLFKTITPVNDCSKIRTLNAVEAPMLGQGGVFEDLRRRVAVFSTALEQIFIEVSS